MLHEETKRQLNSDVSALDELWYRTKAEIDLYNIYYDVKPELVNEESVADLKDTLIQLRRVPDLLTDVLNAIDKDLAICEDELRERN